MKRILLYSPFIKVGGIEKVSIEYLNALLQKDYKVDLLIDFDMGKDGNTFEFAIPKGVNFQYIKSERISKFIYFFRTLGKKNNIFNIFLYGFIILFDFYYYHTKVKKLVRNKKYDYIISFYQFLPAYITNIKSAKHMIWLHNPIETFFGGIKNLFVNNFEKKLNKYDYIITIANEMREELIDFYPNLPKDKIKRVYNPFDFEMIKKKSMNNLNLNEADEKLLNSKYICTVARLDETHKDITTLIKAYSSLYQMNKIKHKLYIIGDGPDKLQLETLVRELKLSDEILFLGKRVNPYIWMRCADIFILSSKFEGFGLVLVEAMCVETFVISSNCKTGPNEILLNGRCGDLVDVGDINILAQKIKYVLENKEYREGKIHKASKRINEFSKELVLTEVEKLF